MFFSNKSSFLEKMHDAKKSCKSEKDKLCPSTRIDQRCIGGSFCKYSHLDFPELIPEWKWKYSIPISLTLKYYHPYKPQVCHNDVEIWTCNCQNWYYDSHLKNPVLLDYICKINPRLNDGIKCILTRFKEHDEFLTCLHEVLIKQIPKTLLLIMIEYTNFQIESIVKCFPVCGYSFGY